MNNQNIKNFFETNLKLILAIIGIALLSSVGYIVVREKNLAKEKEASSALYEARKMTDPLVQAKDYKSAISLLQDIPEKFPNSRAAYETNLHIADLYVEMKDPAKAIAHYAKAEQQAPDSFSKILATYSKAIAEEVAGQFDQAVKSLDFALQMKGSEFLKPEILMAQARSYEALKNFSKAAEIYKTIQEKYASKTYYSNAAAAFLGKISIPTGKQ